MDRVILTARDSLPSTMCKYDFAEDVYNKVFEYQLFDYNFLIDMSQWCEEYNLEHFVYKFYALTD